MEESQVRQTHNRRKSDHGEKVRGVRIRLLNVIVVVLAIVVALVFLQAAQRTQVAYDELTAATDAYVECEKAANGMESASNYLTIQCRTYVISHDMRYADRYYREVEVDDRRGAALEMLRENLGSEEAQEHLQDALMHSDLLSNRESYAMRLAAESEKVDPSTLNADLRKVELTPMDNELTGEEQAKRAVDLLFDDEYTGYVDQIEQDIDYCRAELLTEMDKVQDEIGATLNQLYWRQRILTVALLCIMVLNVILIVALVLRPLKLYSDHISKNQELPAKGAYELRYLAQAYNIVLDENRLIHEQLLNRAERDHLTGLYNRSVFEGTVDKNKGVPVAMLLIDADYFKNVNDTLGHDAGDAMLQKVATLLNGTFRMTDYPCRIGGDEFAVIMTDITPALKDVVIDRIEIVRRGLSETDGNLPPMTISVGVAFSDGSLDGTQLYKNADKALYEVKESGRNGYRFYED